MERSWLCRVWLWLNIDHPGRYIARHTFSRHRGLPVAVLVLTGNEVTIEDGKIALYEWGIADDSLCDKDHRRLAYR